MGNIRKHITHYISATLIIACLLVGCGTSGTTTGAAPKAASATATATPTIVPTPTSPTFPHLSLAWAGQPLSYDQWAFAPTDGATVYGCTFPGADAQGNALATHDAGAHTVSIQVTMANHGGRCTPIADEGDADISILKIASDGHGPYLAQPATVPQSAPGPGNELFDLITMDGGQSWATVPNNVTIAESATGGGVTYALVSTTGNGNPVHLARSTDGFASWQRVDPPNLALPLGYISNAGDNMRHIWVNPDGQHILFVNSATATISASGDGGQTWTSFPGLPSNFSDIAVQPPIAGQPWHICTRDGNTTQCTSDGGKQWTNRPAPGISYTLFALTTSDDLLAVGSQTNSTSFMLLRLPANSNQWQSLGPLPGSQVRYYPAPRPGVVWSHSIDATPYFAPQEWYLAPYAPK